MSGAATSLHTSLPSPWVSLQHWKSCYCLLGDWHLVCLRQSFPLPAYVFAFCRLCSPFIPTRILLFPYSVLVCGQDFIFWFVMSLSQFMSCPFAGGVFGFSFFDISVLESLRRRLFTR